MTDRNKTSEKKQGLAGQAARQCALAIREGIEMEVAMGSLPGFVGLIQLESSKGLCYKLDLYGVGPLFVKVLEDEGKAENEASLSSRLVGLGIGCPVPLAVEGRVLVRDYLGAATAAEELDLALKWGDVASASRLCKRVAELLADIHMVDSSCGHGLVVNDLNLKNFLVSSNCSLSIIDLAEAGYGDQPKDLGALMVHILTHRPEFTDISAAMADSALDSYFTKAGKLWDVTEASAGLEEALADASIRRARPELPGLASWYVSHLKERAEATTRRSHHGAED